MIDSTLVGKYEFFEFLNKALTGNLAVGDSAKQRANTGRIQVCVKLNSGTVSAGIVSVYKEVDTDVWAKVSGADYPLATITDASHVSPPLEIGVGNFKFVVTDYAGSSFNYDLGKIDY